MLTTHKMWGIESHENELAFPCDQFVNFFDDIYYRGITICAKPENIFRWLCQMRIAPYSYDWIDNLGRKSPSKLTSGADKLKTGQNVMTIFELIDFVQNKYLTIRTKKNQVKSTTFGSAVISYVIIQKNNGTCRLLVKLVVNYPKGLYGKFLRFILPLGDLIMMRCQLLNFKKLSEQMETGK